MAVEAIFFTFLIHYVFIIFFHSWSSTLLSNCRIKYAKNHDSKSFDEKMQRNKEYVNLEKAVEDDISILPLHMIGVAALRKFF